MNRKVIAIGYDLSTTALTVAGMPKDGIAGDEVVVSIPMRGATTWLVQPAHDLKELPNLFIDALRAIQAQGYEFAPDGVISGSVRQHDMVLADANSRPIRPALSWQCNAAEKQVEMLRNKGAEEQVGRLEPRLVLPKLLWAMEQDPGLKDSIATVMTTGDFIAMQLSGTPTLCSSEALSNGLMTQETRQFAFRFLASVPGLDLSWFPTIAYSGSVIEPRPSAIPLFPDWKRVRELLPGWRVVAGLGDNHAGALGGGLSDCNTMVISAGTSGTVVRAVNPKLQTGSRAMKFEYFENTLLLMMMPDCAAWYKRFKQLFAGTMPYAELDALALAAQNHSDLVFHDAADAPWPDWFCKLSLGEQDRNIQSSIAYQLAILFMELFSDEVIIRRGDEVHWINRVVFTGGLTASRWFCQSLSETMRIRGHYVRVEVSSRTGPLANQAATLGALINALVGGGLIKSREEAIKTLCPTRKLT